MRARRTLKAIVTCALAVLTLPSVVSAQTSRVEGMAVPGDYIKDYTGIYTYISGVTNVGNLVYGEFGRAIGGTATDRAVGSVLGNLWDGRFGTWGIHLRQFTPSLGQGDAFTPVNPGGFGSDPNFNANEAIDLMWGRKSGTTSFGLRFNRSYFRDQDALPGVITSVFQADPSGALTDPNLARNVTGLGAGIGFEMNPNTNIELSLLYQNRSFEVSDTPVPPGVATSNEDDGPTTYMLAGRAMWQWRPDVLVIPVVRYYSFDLANKTVAGPTTTSFDNSLKGWQAGVSGNWTLGTNDLLVLGVAFAQNSVEQQYDIFGVAADIAASTGTPIGDELKISEMITPLVFASLETHVNSWLTFRMGAQKGAYEKLTVEDQAASAREIETTSASFLMNIGTGVKLGTLQLDAVLNNTFPHTLGGFFSNIANFVAFPKVTATYAF